MMGFMEMRRAGIIASAVAAVLIGAGFGGAGAAPERGLEDRAGGAPPPVDGAAPSGEPGPGRGAREERAVAEIGWGDQLVVCDFGSDPKEADCVPLGLALAQGVRERLFELGKVNVLGFAATGALAIEGEGLGLSEAQLESARRAHCGWVVTGTVARSGEDYSLVWDLQRTAAAPQQQDEERIGFARARAHRAEAQVAEAVVKSLDGALAGGVQAEMTHLEMAPEAYLEYGQGLLLLREGNCSEANRVLEQLARVHPKELRILQVLLLSVACAAEGKSTATLAQGIADLMLRWRHLCRELVPLPARWTEDSEALYRRGTDLDSTGEDATASYDRSLSISPHYADARLKAWAARANSKQYSRAVEDLMRGLRLAPDSVGARHTLGLCLAVAGRPAEAEAELQSALALDPAAPDRAGVEEALGLLALQAGDVERAGQHVQRGLALLPDDPSLLTRAGMLALMAGRISEARSRLDRATRRAPKMAEAWVALSTCALAEGDVDGAIEILTRAREISPDEPVIYENLARAYDATGMTAQAVEARRRAVELREGQMDTGVEVAVRSDGKSVVESQVVTPEKSRLAGEIELAVELLCAQDAAGAMEILRRAEEREPDDLLLRAVAGVALLVLGDPDQARAHLAAVGPLGEGPAQTLRQLGVGLYRSDRLPGSIAALEIAIRSLPGDRSAGVVLENAREQLELSRDRTGWNLIPGPLPFAEGMCLPSSIAMAMGHWPGRASEPRELAAIKREIIAHVRDPHRIASAVGFLMARGWFSILCQSSLEELERLIDDGYPVVAMLRLESTDNSGHACLVVGYDRERRVVITHDPNHKAFFVVPYDRFDEQWRWDEGPVRGGRMALLLCPPDQATERLRGLAESPLWRATRANALLELGRREEALDELDLARETAPEEGYVAHELVLAYLQLARWNDARQAALRAIELRPSTQCLYRHLEQAYLSEGLAAEAVERAERWLEDSARGAGPALLKAKGLSAMGRLDEAAEVLQTAVRDHPDSAAAHHYLAELRVMEGDFAGAVEPAKTAVRLDPQESAHHMTLVMAHIQTGETDQALAAIEDWIDAAPDQPAPFLARASLLAEEHPDEAARSLERALELDPRSVQAHKLLGAALLARGRYEESAAALRDALELASGDAEILRLLEQASGASRSTGDLEQ